ncbi:mechanosensitive ion channel [Stieleria sp. JC731]|uniref:mechanosensitive ion channel family protein n=1 Tax=Pirellulaceae TaxID=2691357 RepID=UPI001E3C5305|nr:mechanosensitive ion channel family protein [Stieleria sp. JC731]MCC9602778.1 mechanosensitive ion channel [Stieleria sp. JC731]
MQFVFLFTFLAALSVGGSPVETTDAASTDGSETSVQEESPVEVEAVIADEAIENRLRSIFSARERFEDVKVSVRSGVATLSGRFETQEDADWAERLVERTKGVVVVEDEARIDSEIDFAENWTVISSSLGKLWKDFLRRSPLLIAGVITLFLTVVVSKSVQWGLAKLFKRQSRVRASLRDLVLQLATIGVWVAGLLITAVVVFPGMTPTRALTLLGVGSVAIGFAFKDIFENFFAGILILWRYPFDMGDFISSDDLTGQVEEINIRNTLIRRLDGELSVIPNAALFKTAVDVLTDRPNRRVRIICGVAYGENVDQARDVIADAVRSCLTVDGERMVEVFANEFADSSINFEVAWWTGSKPGEVRRSRDEVVSAIKSALDSEGIEIPFPYRTLTFSKSIPVSIWKGSEKQDADRDGANNRQHVPVDAMTSSHHNGHD